MKKSILLQTLYVIEKIVQICMCKRNTFYFSELYTNVPCTKIKKTTHVQNERKKGVAVGLGVVVLQGGPKKCYPFCTFVTVVFIHLLLNGFLNSINKEWHILSIPIISIPSFCECLWEWNCLVALWTDAVRWLTRSWYDQVLFRKLPRSQNVSNLIIFPFLDKQRLQQELHIFKNHEGDNKSKQTYSMLHQWGHAGVRLAQPENTSV